MPPKAVATKQQPKVA